MQSEQPKYGIGMTVSACVWLGLFPLLQGGTYARLTHDKWIVMLVLTGVTLLCFLAEWVVTLSDRRKKSGAGASLRTGNTHPDIFPLLLAGALTLWTVLSCLVSGADPKTWWIAESARYEGLATRLCYFLLFACFFFSRVRLKPVLLSAAAGVTVFFIIVLLQRNGGNPLGLYPAGRSYALNPEFQGTIGNIDMDTGYLLLLAGLFLYGLINLLFHPEANRGHLRLADLSFRPGPKGLWRNSACCVVYLLALCLTLYLILTMGVQFGVISLAVLLLSALLRFFPKKARLPFLVFLLILILLVVWFWPGQNGGIWELHEILHGRGRLSFGSDRVAVWLYSLRLSGERPLFGGGAGTFPSRFNSYLSDNGLVIPQEQDGLPLPDYFDNPHNEYIQQLTDHGLPALLLFAALLFLAVFRRRDRRLPAPCSAAVLAYAVQAFFSFSVCLVAPMFWVLLALSFRE